MDGEKMTLLISPVIVTKEKEKLSRICFNNVLTY